MSEYVAKERLVGVRVMRTDDGVRSQDHRTFFRFRFKLSSAAR